MTSAHPKPDPEPYLKAAALLDLEPSACVAVEDSGPGMTSALAAGMSVILVNSSAASTLSVPAGVVVAADHYRAEEVLFGSQGSMRRHNRNIFIERPVGEIRLRPVLKNTAGHPTRTM